MSYSSPSAHAYKWPLSTQASKSAQQKGKLLVQAEEEGLVENAGGEGYKHPQRVSSETPSTLIFLRAKVPPFSNK